ncbi:MAG TPA: PA2169 family four-helix-bundle protein [Arenimonas sp.]|uniref:PA2169 family four-helix-bundle protein n=1 Tax=Arenimonas sp. TaxID=1872635 RepID=UPI002D7F7364|nr:PA2169 family four-helix-bundle protein [Arenimonas sp.]HEU0153310.1 PA2169 family four-helix-bundle protein [Arenimonas sp.]
MTTNNTELRKEKIETLNELIQATRDSANFYADAADAVTNPGLSTLFGELAESKKGLVGSMSREVRAEAAEPAQSGTLRGSLHQLYSTLRAEMARDHGDYAYVKELEKSEDRLMAAFHDVIKRDDAPKAVKESLLSYLPKVQQHHDAMRDRKWAMEARH